MDNSILSNSYTTKNTFYLTWSKWTLEMQLSVSIFPAIPQTATGQNGNKADHCHHTSILNVAILETLTRQEVDLHCGNPGDIICRVKHF